MQATPRGTLQERLTKKFRKVHGYAPNLSAPETFNEKILHRMIFDRRGLLTTFADKIAVRDHVQQRLGSGELLSRIYRIFDGPDDLYTFEFPSRFVLKANHGSGWNYIHHGPRAPNRDALARLGRLWLNSNYALQQGEWCYSDVPPKLFCEENLAPDSADLINYRFYCFSGTARFIQLDFDLHTFHKRNIYDRDWTRLDVQYNRYPPHPDPPVPPPNLAQMISIAERLSHGVDFVRVDLYDLGDRVVFGELTNYPSAGNGRFHPQTWDGIFGSYWRLSDLTFPAPPSSSMPLG